MLFRLRSIPTLLLTLSASAAVTIACGDDKGTGEEHGENEPQICKDISSVCHDADNGAGMANECHEMAHAGDAAVCEMIHDECIAFCTGGTGTETGTTMTSTTMSSTTDPTTEAETGTEEGTTQAHDDSGSSGHQDESSTSGADHGTGETGANACDELGSGCHDNKTPEGMECHEIGHAGDVPACEKAYEMCAKICGL